MKRILLFFCLFSFVIYFSISLNAASLVNVDTVYSTEILDGGVEYGHEKITTSGYSNGSYTSDVNYMKISGDNKNVKIASWSYNARYQTTLVTLDKIAEDYEKNHPGWIVVGGVNAEGYHTNSPYAEASNLFVQDGMLIRSGISSESFKELIAFYDDNSYSIERFPKLTEKMILRLYNQNDQELNNYNIDGLNRLPLDNEITVISLENETNLSLGGYYAAECSYELYRRKTFYIEGCYPIGNSRDGILSCGEILGTASGEIKARDYKFYIVSKDKNVIDNITKASSYRCMHEFTGEFKNAHSVCGYMFKLIENGHVMTPDDKQDNSEAFKTGITRYDDSYYYRDHSYATTNGKNRSCIGFDKDGGIILLTATNSSGGPSQWQLGNILQSKGYTNAYQFDGGGSVTFVKRDELGNQKIVCEQATGTRSIATGLFFVVKDPGFKVTGTSRNSLTFKCENSDVTNAYVVINNNKYPFKGSECIVDNLEEDTEYQYSFEYNIPSITGENSVTRTRTYKKSTDAYMVPSGKFSVNSVSKHSIVVERKNIVDDIFDVVVHVGDASYNMGDNTIFACDNLIDDIDYEVYFTYKVKDKETSNIYEGISDIINIHTTNYEVPVIEIFRISKELNNGKATFEYKYLDPDKVVVECLLYYNNFFEECVNGKYDFVTVEGIDESVDCYLVITYKDNNDESHEIKSEKIRIEVEQKNNDPEPDEPTPVKKKGCSKKTLDNIILINSLSVLLYFIIKKRH